MHIGCLFGTFDPPHRAHVAIADHMRRTQGLDQVWLVVTPQNPFKVEAQISPDAHRLAMVRLAVSGQEDLVASGFELDLPKPNYTAETLRFMRQRWPDHRFDLIVGSDNLAVFHRWRSPDEILEHHGLLVYPREGFKDHLASTIYHGHPGIKIVTDAPVMPISATRIREDIRAWRPVEDRVAPAVLSYIRQHGLYLH